MKVIYDENRETRMHSSLPHQNVCQICRTVHGMHGEGSISGRMFAQLYVGPMRARQEQTARRRLLPVSTESAEPLVGYTGMSLEHSLTRNAALILHLKTSVLLRKFFTKSSTVCFGPHGHHQGRV
jgi:hypothetical protein